MKTTVHLQMGNQWTFIETETTSQHSSHQEIPKICCEDGYIFSKTYRGGFEESEESAALAEKQLHKRKSALGVLASLLADILHLQDEAIASYRSQGQSREHNFITQLHSNF